MGDMVGFQKPVKETPLQRKARKQRRRWEKQGKEVIVKGNTMYAVDPSKMLIKRPRRAVKAKKRVKLPSLPKLIRKADSVFSKWIRNRDGFKCVLQGPKCHGAIQCGHLIKRGKKSVRWDELNCHALCSYHNFLDNMEPQHYVSWFIKNYGALPYQDLVERSRGVFKPSREYLNEIIKKYKV